MNAFSIRHVFRQCLFTVVLLASAISVIALASSNPEALKPQDAYSKTSQAVLKLLLKEHYKRVELDNTFSQKMLDRYLEYLDSSKSHFLESDIKSFKPYRNKLDDALKKGDLDPAFDIFNHFQQRRVQRTRFMLEELEKPIEKTDFTESDDLLIERKNQPWLVNMHAAEMLWRKQLKNDILNLKLADKPFDEIQSLLTKRYTNQLNRILQTKSDDVFQFYMDSFTQIFDPHTRYLPPRESESFDISMSLSLEGIGALLQQEDEYTKVVRLVTAGPAENSKLLKPADRIIGVAQGKEGEMVDVIGWRLDDVVDLIRGPKGTLVRLNLIPSTATDNNENREIHIIRDTVKLEDQAAQKKVFNVEREGKAFKVGIISLPAFYIDFKAAQSGDPDYRSSSKDVAHLVQELKKENIDALIIDLRNNGGGSLQEANILTGLFIKTGPVVQVREQNSQVQILGDRNPSIEYSGPLAVLVNRLSASASEIFAGAIQDSGRGIVIGSQTFGKGTVQTITAVDPGELKYTQAKFYRISGASTQHRGVIPDIEFPEIINKTEIGEDSQDDALPWDQILPTRYSYNPLIAPVIPEIKARHYGRVTDNPDFVYLSKRIHLMDTIRERQSISLNEAQRKKEKKNVEQQLLVIENERRKAKNEPLLSAYKALESAELEEDKKNEIDAFLGETGHILLDLATLANKRIAERSSLTKQH